MSSKEDFLKIRTYQEYDLRRSEFKNLDIHDKEILEHLSELFPKVDNSDFENGIITEVYEKHSKQFRCKGCNMIVIKEAQINELSSYIENIDDIIANGDIQDLLDAIDDVIVDNILGNNDEPDEIGIKLQRIYDEIYNQN